MSSTSRHMGRRSGHATGGVWNGSADGFTVDYSLWWLISWNFARSIEDGFCPDTNLRELRNHTTRDTSHFWLQHLLCDPQGCAGRACRQRLGGDPHYYARYGYGRTVNKTQRIITRDVHWRERASNGRPLAGLGKGHAFQEHSVICG